MPLDMRQVPLRPHPLAALRTSSLPNNSFLPFVVTSILPRADGSERVAQGVAAARVLGDAGAAHGLFHGALDDRLVDVMVALLREDPLPAPVGRGVGVLAALAFADDDLGARELEVKDAQAQALYE